MSSFCMSGVCLLFCSDLRGTAVKQPGEGLMAKARQSYSVTVKVDVGASLKGWVLERTLQIEEHTLQRLQTLN